MADYVVKRGDSLSKIASIYRDRISGNTINAKVDTLVAINGIKNRNLIYVGQEINFSGSGSTSSSASAQQPSNKVNITSLGLQSESSTGRDFFASWSWTRAHTKEYKIRWEWDSPDPTQPNGYFTNKSETTTSDTYSTFSIPEDFRKTANWVQIWITPVSDTYDSTDNKGNTIQVAHFTDAVETGKQYFFKDNPPLKLSSAPEVTIDTSTLILTASYNNIVASDLDAVSVKFNIVQDNTTSIHTSDPVTINTVGNSVSYQYTVEPGHTYTVRACAVGSNGKESGWTDFSGSEGTQPSAPTGLTVRRDTHVDNNNKTETHSVFLEWSPVNNATKYNVEYTTTISDFDTAGSNVSVESTDDSTPSLRIGINSEDLGSVYYFRVKAVNEEGTSKPSEIVELPIGKPPGPPTTWSSSNSAFVGETMELNWIHNPTDNSRQTYAQISFNFNDEKDSNGKFVWNDLEAMVNFTDTNDTEEVTKEYIYGTAVSYKGDLYFKMDTNHVDFKNAKIQWKVRTAGVENDLDNDSWSVARTIYIYEKPTLGLSMTSDLAGNNMITTLTTFPFYVRGELSLTDYSIQKPVGYHLQVISNNYYTTVDDVGRTKTINPGDAVYSKYFNTSETLVVEMSANNLDLESGIDYTIYCTADMSSGLAVAARHDFTVSWIDVEYAIDADISINTESYTALITPYCKEKIPVPGGKNLFNVNNMGHTKNTTVDNDVITTEFINASRYINDPGLSNIKQPVIYPKGTYTMTIIPVTDVISLSVAVYDCDNVGKVEWFYLMNVNDAYSFTFTKDTDFIPCICGMYHADEIYYGTFSYKIQLELGSEATEYEEYYETYEDGDLVENVTLSVYRREYDGSYKEIATGIPNNYTAVTDPHPALDYARYRFAAKDTRTGALSFWDMPGRKVNGSAIVIQWDEVWSTFDTGESTVIEGPSWSGSLLKLPYNIKVSDKRNTEVSLVNYAGRKHPVSYYGTQINESSQWSVEIPKDDKDTIYALRRLSLWSGDVYVREPSGMGYWANVVASFNLAYNDVKVPVTLDVTRVEGGV